MVEPVETLPVPVVEEARQRCLETTPAAPVVEPVETLPIPVVEEARQRRLETTPAAPVVEPVETLRVWWSRRRASAVSRPPGRPH